MRKYGEQKQNEPLFSLPYIIFQQEISYRIQNTVYLNFHCVISYESYLSEITIAGDSYSGRSKKTFSKQYILSWVLKAILGLTKQRSRALQEGGSGKLKENFCDWIKCLSEASQGCWHKQGGNH